MDQDRSGLIDGRLLPASPRHLATCNGKIYHHAEKLDVQAACLAQDCRAHMACCAHRVMQLEGSTTAAVRDLEVVNAEQEREIDRSAPVTLQAACFNSDDDVE